GAFPRPVVAGVNGYARSFIEQYVSNVILIEPTNANELVSKIKNNTYHIENRKIFIDSFNRKQINAEMVASISRYL
ncbi:hypothetical protein ACEV9J_23925, partial [Vibrio parahaemolyticus]